MPNDIVSVIGSYIPLMQRGSEWESTCPFEKHSEPLSVIDGRWRCFGCAAHESDDSATGFLMLIEKCTHDKAEEILNNGRDWSPTLLRPEPPVSRFGFKRAESFTDKTILICDNRKAAIAAEKLLNNYLICNWPDGNSRWGELDPLRKRNLLLWPTHTAPAVAAMQRLAAVLTDPNGLACTGKIILPADVPDAWNLANAQAEGMGSAEVIAWAKAHVTLLNPAPQSAGAAMPGPDVPPPPSESGQSSAALDPPPPADFPPEASSTPPKRRKRRLRIVGGDAIDALESIDPDAAPLPHELSESGIAAHFVAQHKDRFRTVFEWAGKQGACWMAWDGSRWLREPNRVSAMQHAQTLAHGVKFWDAAKQVAELSKVKFESRKFIGAFLDLASYAPEFVAAPELFDADPMLLGTPAGTVDLATGKLIAPEREHYLTRQTAIAPEPGAHPLFDDVVRRAAGGEQDMADYLWRWFGYLLTGLTKEKAFLYLHGKTDSGKTTLATAIAAILGNADAGGYAAQCDIEMFTEQKIDKGSDKLAHLAGARFAYASEMDEGKNFKSALLKLATGADALHGRFLYSEQFSFTPTHKLWIFGNHKMHMKSSDGALLNRLHLLEYKDAFIVTPEERDNNFQEKLRAEYPAILASMIKATGIYLDCNGLGRPERMATALDEYASSEDTLGQWIAECLDVEPTARASAAEAYQSFSRWSDREGAFVPSAKRFGQQLVDRGFARARPGGVRSFIGFSLKLRPASDEGYQVP